MQPIKRLLSSHFGLVVWIPAALIFVAALLTALFVVVYQPSHPGQAWELQAWQYLGSEQFKIAAVSLGLPLLLLFIETQFKFVQRLQETRQKQIEAQQAERLAILNKERDERTERRLETLALTQQMLEDLFNLAAEVIWYRRASVQPTAADAEMEAVLKRLWSLHSRGILAMIQWMNRLDISEADAASLLAFINVVMMASDGTARYLRDGERPAEERVAVQAALEVIVDRSKSICHSSILLFMDLSMQLRELAEAEETAAQRASLESRLAEHMTGLRAWKVWMDDFQKQNEVLLGGIEAAEVLDLRTVVSAAEEWLAAEADRDLGTYEQYDGLRNSLYAVPTSTRYAQGAFYYSDQFIKTLADQMLFDFLLDRIRERARPSQ